MPGESLSHRHQIKMPRNKFSKTIARKSRNEVAVFEEPSFSWSAPEYEHFEKRPKWYWIMGAILVAIVVYAIATNSLLMAITFILIGMLGYVYAEREPRIIRMEIAPEGIRVDNYFYDYDDIRSFWIFYEIEHGHKNLSLHSKKTFLPYIHIPIRDANPIRIRETLLNYLPEIKQELTILDHLEKIIGL
jgi:hypothetical protein